ncbi:MULTISPECIES: hypothetical protein [Paenochrobactrum]|uniref:hypothetical protein n=1 Tax=Paenochrobactrum pullorum TaxID=1324351 RepID=UPI0035BBE517
MGNRGVIPWKYVHLFTEGQRAALTSIFYARRKGLVCTYQQLGEAAGVSETTVRLAIRKAREFGMVW